MKAVYLERIHRLSRSQFVLIILFTSLTLATIRYLLPWSTVLEAILPSWYVEGTEMIFSIFREREQADLAIFGSSLALAPARVIIKNTQPEAKEKVVLNLVYQGYGFQQALQASLPANTARIRNLGVSGAIVSDYSDLLSELESHDHLPQRILLTLAPRDFLDSTLGGVSEATYFRKMLNSYIQLNYFPRILDSGSLLAWCQTNRDFYILAKTCGLKAISTSCESSLQKLRKKPEFEQKPTCLQKSPTQIRKDDLNGYKLRYKSGGKELRNASFKSLGNFMNICRRNRIPMIVILMPLSPNNKEILGNLPLKVMRSEILTEAKENEYKVIDFLDGDLFTNEDFTDSCHLNQFGAAKFFTSLRTKLAGERWIASQ